MSELREGDMPERLWAHFYTGSKTTGRCYASKTYVDQVEYVRSDKYESLQQECEALKVERNNPWKPIRDIPYYGMGDKVREVDHNTKALQYAVYSEHGKGLRWYMEIPAPPQGDGNE